MSETANVSWELPLADAQLVMSILQQALAPYQRLAQVMQEMQRQAMAQQQPRNESRNNPVGQELYAQSRQADDPRGAA